MKWTTKMAEAAKLLGLDPDDERTRRLLLGCIRAASRKRGRPRGAVKWDPWKLINLGDQAELLSRGERRLSDAKLAKLIFEKKIMASSPPRLFAGAFPSRKLGLWVAFVGAGALPEQKPGIKRK